MKITMVGSSGSGKTVFSAGVFSVFMRVEHEGFRILPRAKNFSDGIVEHHKFALDYKMIASRKWPPGTQATNQYPLDLYYEGKKVTNFDWIDYRGGFLDNPELDPAMAIEVHANIAASNAVILFADAQKMTETLDPADAAFRSGADIAMQILTQYSRFYPQAHLTFIIALTKCDAVREEWRENGSYRPLLEQGKEAFKPMADIFRREKNWRGGIIPISALGEGKVDNNGEIIGFPKPLNIEHLMAYCIGSTLRNEQNDIINNFLDLEKRKNIIESQYKGFWGAIRKTFKILNNTNTDPEILQQIRQEQISDSAALQRISGPVMHLEHIALRKVMMLV